MRFIGLVKSKDGPVEPPPADFLAAMEQLIKDAAADGCAMVGSGGLYPTEAGARVRLSGGKVSVIDGPFAEAKEVVGGFAMFDARSKAAMLKWTVRFMEVHKQYLPAWEGETEIRQLYEEGQKPCEMAAEAADPVAVSA
jgi:hypothetical protein